jgi:DNA-binding GntR family transcriptional regulator
MRGLSAEQGRSRAPAEGDSDSLVDRLTADILFGRLMPRERLVEDDLIARFGATRHAVRQALIDLEQLGMLVRVPNKGATVRDFTIEEVAQINAVREILHAQAADMIAMPVAPEALARLEALHKRHSQEVANGNLIGIHHANNAFHEALFALCGNPYLVRTIADYAHLSLAFRCQLMANPKLARRARDQHAAMLKALRDGDRARLVQLCMEHTRPSNQVYLEMRGRALSQQ